jgi:hypothetical protein
MTLNRIINITVNGSIFFCKTVKITSEINRIFFQNPTDNNVMLFKKHKIINLRESEHPLNLKKKYLK